MELITCECNGETKNPECPVHFGPDCKPYALGACCLTWEATRAGHSRSCGNHPDPLPLTPMPNSDEARDYMPGRWEVWQ